jgi:hypothetical protein
MNDPQNQAHNLTDYGFCPLPATHRRLAEAHLLWHQALSKYQEPDAFHANLNATIQALRNVTWILQSEKRSIANFDEWYAGWQVRLDGEPDAKWLIKARNLVVKQGDLEVTSVAVVRVLTWKDDVLMELPVPPGAATSLILNNMPLLDLIKETQIPANDLRDAAIEIERRWSVAALEGRELLETLARVYGLLSDLVLDAHARVNQMKCIPLDPTHSDFRSAYHRTGMLECMAMGREQRTERSQLASGQAYDVVFENSQTPADDERKARKRYKLDEGHYPGSWQRSDPIVVAEDILSRAKEILKKDKSHARMLFIRDGQGEWRLMTLSAADRTEKHILMRVVASYVERVGADAVIDVSESWLLPSNAFHELKVHEIQDAPSREEVLLLSVVTREGICRTYSTAFRRGVFGQIKLEDTDQSYDARVLHYLAPVFDVWRRQGTRKLKDGHMGHRVWEPDLLDTCFCGGPRRYIECCSQTIEDYRTSDLIQQDVQTAVENGDLSRAEQLARAALAQYVIWIKQHTAPTRHRAEDLHQYLISVDVLALQFHVRQITETFTDNGHADAIVPALLHISEIVGVPEIAIRLSMLVAQSRWESGDIAGAVAEVEALGRLEDVNDTLALVLATKLVDLPGEQVIELLTRAALAAYCVSEKISAKLALAKHLLGSGNRESALREVDSAIADASTDKDARSALAEALCFRWNISNDEEDFRAARKALEELGREEHWQPLASLLIDHGDYDDANAVLKKALDAGDIVAHLLAVDVRLRMEQPDSARELLLTLAADAIPSRLQYPYAHTMGLVALMCEDPVLRRTAAMKLRKAVADTPLMKSAHTLLVALESDDAS